LVGRTGIVCNAYHTATASELDPVTGTNELDESFLKDIRTENVVSPQLEKGGDGSGSAKQNGREKEACC